MKPQMKPILLGAAAALIAAPLMASAAFAALQVGAKAPDFTAEAAMKGKPFTYALADARKKGPVVVYFFPKANTGTCDLEAHAFADKIADFKAQGATVIGVSRDDLPTLETFSTAKCSDAFPVASDLDGKISAAFDAKLPIPMVKMSNRVSYVVAPDGTVIYEYAALGQSHEHAENTLAALTAWRAKQKS